MVQGHITLTKKQTYYCDRDGAPVTSTGQIYTELYRYPFRFVSRQAHVDCIVHDRGEFIAAMRLHAEAGDVFLRASEIEEIADWCVTETDHRPKRMGPHVPVQYDGFLIYGG